MTPEAEENIKLIKSCGYRAFMRDGGSGTYAYYTDGTNIGYVQWGQSPMVATVQIPNHASGSGYVYDDMITPESLEGAMKCYVPSWARLSEGTSVRKYRDWDTFHNKDSYTKGLQEV